MVREAHPTVLRGARLGRGDARPLILERLDQEFLPTVLRDLRTPEGREKVAASVAQARDEGSVLRLYQPVHRTFHLVLLEAVCDHFPQPRLDPARIESAGLVIRRLGAAGSEQGWMQTEDAIRGWVTIPPTEADLDPDPARRRPPLRAGHPLVTQRLAQPPRALQRFSEAVAPLFVAPPEVCEAAGRTLLYALIPLTSAERSEAPVDASGVYTRDDARGLLPPFLRAGARSYSPGQEKSDPDVSGGLSFLGSLGVFDAVSAPASALFDLLEGLRATAPSNGEQRQLGTLLKSAAGVFRDPTAARPMRAFSWTLSAADEDRLADGLRAVMEHQVAGLATASPRYDPRGGQYRLRAFIRAKVCEECPPELVWSPASEAFTIVPWYESGNAPPVQVALPDVTDPRALRKLKPDVAFIAPEKLMKRVNATSLKDHLVAGAEPPTPASAAIDWICGFNIPIITICAMIVLSIFLSLLNLLFWWLPFVKICLPIPRRPSPPPGP